MYPISIKGFRRAFIALARFLSRHSKPARELASRHVASNERGWGIRNTSPAVSISFVNQENSIYSYGAGGGHRYRIPGGTQAPRRLSFILSDSLSESEFLPSGFTLELKEQPSRLPSLFHSLLLASLFLSFRPVLGNEGVRKYRESKENK